MDPLTVFAIATGCVQLLDFSIKTTHVCREVFERGSTTENDELEDRAKQLKLLQQKLKTVKPSPGDTPVEELARECAKVASELEEVLQKINKPGSGPRAWKNLIKAGRTVREKSNLVKIEQSIRKYLEQLDTEILVDIRRRIDQFETQDQDRFRALDDQYKQMIAACDQQHLADLVTQEHTGTGNGLILAVTEVNSLAAGNYTDLKQAVAEEGSITRQDFATRHINARCAEIESALREQILESLFFPEIHAREESIDEAHAATFNWIYDEQRHERSLNKRWDSFSTWLKSEGGMYWINGRAGSGKSTLMQYLVQDDRTSAILRDSAGGSDMFVVKFFFWKPGSQLQRSSVGLLRSLLWQLLVHNPDLCAKASIKPPHREPIPVWTESRLKKCVTEAVRQMGRPCAFFIDGLDEFDGSAIALVELCSEISSIENTKVCVSSRPETVFEEAFKAKKNLRLQDLTRSDIRRYVDDRLDVLPDTPRTHTIKEYMVQKADGIFLWIRLAVDSLLQGHYDGDDEEELFQRLREIPAGLEELYTTMLGNMRQSYLEEAMGYFLFCSSYHNVTLLQYVLGWDSDFKEIEATLYGTAVLSKDVIIAKCLRFIKRLKSRSCGLLDVSQYGVRNPQILNLKSFISTRVVFIHLTAKDFVLGSESLWSKMDRKTIWARVRSAKLQASAGWLFTLPTQFEGESVVGWDPLWGTRLNLLFDAVLEAQRANDKDCDGILDVMQRRCAALGDEMTTWALEFEDNLRFYDESLLTISDMVTSIMKDKNVAFVGMVALDGRFPGYVLSMISNLHLQNKPLSVWFLIGSSIIGTLNIWVIDNDTNAIPANLGQAIEGRKGTRTSMLREASVKLLSDLMQLQLHERPSDVTQEDLNTAQWAQLVLSLFMWMLYRLGSERWANSSVTNEHLCHVAEALIAFEVDVNTSIVKYFRHGSRRLEGDLLTVEMEMSFLWLWEFAAVRGESAALVRTLGEERSAISRCRCVSVYHRKDGGDRVHYKFSDEQSGLLQPLLDTCFERFANEVDSTLWEILVEESFHEAAHEVVGTG